MPLSGFGKIVRDCPCIISCLNPHFCLCFSLSVSVSAYITANFECTLPVFLSHFLSVYTSDRIYYHSVLVYKYVSWSVFLSLIFYDCLCVYLAIFLVTDSTYIGTSLIPRFRRISLYLCLSQCPGILSVICMCVNKRVQLSQCVITL